LNLATNGSKEQHMAAAVSWAHRGWGGLVPGRRDPKDPSRLTDDMVTDIRARRLGGASLQAIAAAAEVSTNTVARALNVPEPMAGPEAGPAAPTLEAGPEAGSAAPARHPNPLPGTDQSCYEVKPRP